MAMDGSFVPAKKMFFSRRSNLCMVAPVMIQQRKKYFMVEMEETASIIKRSYPKQPDHIR